MIVTFYGVRGSTPCSSPDSVGYGGNTSCIVVSRPGEPPLLLDLGTGLRQFGAAWPSHEVFAGTALVSHLHWDHVQGLPFFAPALRAGATLEVYAPAQDDGRTVSEAFDAFMRPPYFPITLEQLPAEVRFHDCEEGTFAVGGFEITARLIPHVGRTLGFRVECDGLSIAYLPDHQQPHDGGNAVADAALDLCRGVDLLIHDAQFTPEEFAQRCHWGHCTMDYAVAVALEAGVKTLALFHHDPSHTDAMLFEMHRGLVASAGRQGLCVIGAREHASINLSA